LYSAEIHGCKPVDELPTVAKRIDTYHGRKSVVGDLLCAHRTRLKHNSDMARRNKILTILFSAAIVGVGFIYSDSLARFVWKEYQFVKLATALNRNDALLFVKIGNYYVNVRNSGAYDLAEAEKYFMRALNTDPNIRDAWHQLARIDFLRGNLDGALEKINRQIDIHGESFMASFYIRGLIYGYRRDFYEAERDFNAFLEWSPANWAAHNDLAWIYFQKGDFEKAEATARRGMERAGENAWLLTSLGVALLNLGRNDEARSVLEKAMALAGGLDEADWMKAYPGNDPRLAGRGLALMKETITYNLGLVK